MERISRLKLLKNVPFEKERNTILTFESQDAQSTFFELKAYKQFTNLSYVKGFIINKVQLQCDLVDIKECNYLMYENLGEDRWIYGYITNIQYISDLTTEVEFEIDYFQTYMGEIVFKSSAIDRQHIEVNQDGLSNPYLFFEDGRAPQPDRFNILAYQNETWGDSVVAIYYRPNLIIQKVLQGASNWETTESGGTVESSENEAQYKKADDYYDEHGIDAFGGLPICVYDRIYSGVNVRVMTISNQTDVDNVSKEITKMNLTGYKVIAVRIIPKTFYTTGQKYPNAILKHNAFKLNDTMKNPFNKKSSLKYTPINTKCFTYPYMFLMATNRQGGNKIYKYEKFTGYITGFSQGDLCFYKDEDITDRYKMLVTPAGYEVQDGQEGHSEYDALSYGMDNGISTEHDTDITYNDSSSGVLGAGNFLKGLIKALGGLVTLSPGLAISGAADMFSGTKSVVNGNDGNYVSNPTSFMLILEGLFGIGFLQYCCDWEELQAIDDYFSMYGYNFKGVEDTPNILGRKRFNYVKLINPQIGGSIPNECKKYIIDKLSEGVTFWHDLTNFDYGDFSTNYIDSGKTLTNGKIFEY